MVPVHNHVSTACLGKHVRARESVCWVDGSCPRGQTVDPVVDVLFPPADRPGVFAAEADGWRERPVPFPTPDRGPAQPGDLKDFGQSHDPPGPRMLCRLAPTRGARPDVVGLVFHSSFFSCSLLAVLCRPAGSGLASDRDGHGVCWCHRRYRGGSVTRLRIHPLGVALNCARSRIHLVAVAHPCELGFVGAGRRARKPPPLVKAPGECRWVGHDMW